MWIGFYLTAHADRSVTLDLIRPPCAAGFKTSPVSWARDEASGCVVATQGRIYYQDDLRPTLGQEGVRGLRIDRRPSDAEFALHVFRAAGQTGLERLEGDFSIAVWDAPGRRLLGLRDPLGGAPLYWWHDGSDAGMSSRLPTGLGGSFESSVDPEYLAECLMRSMSVGEPRTELTPLRQVRRIPPGVLLELPLRGKLRRHVSWSWAERISPQSADDERAAGVGLLERLRAAVRERVAGRRVAAHLSGGLDSTAVTAVAASVLTAHGRDERLTTLSLVYNRGDLANERLYIDAALASIGRLDPRLLVADDLLDYGLADGPGAPYDEPRSGLRGLATHRALADAADLAGADVILTGVGSDEILIDKRPHLADAIRRGRWIQAYRGAVARAREWNQGIWSILVEDGFAFLSPIMAREGIGPFLMGGRASWPRLGSFTVPPWVERGFAKRFHLFERGRANAHRLYAPEDDDPTNRRIVEASVGDWNRSYLTTPRGIDLSHPFRDPRLICYTLGLVEGLRSPSGQSKRVLREAARGLIPEEVRLRRGKRGFDEVNGQALHRHRHRIEAWIRGSTIRELGIIDVGRLSDALRQAAVGIGDAPACDRLGQTLALMLWYDQWTRRTNRPGSDSLRFDPLAGEATSVFSRAAHSNIIK